MLSHWPHGFFTREAVGYHPSHLAAALGLPEERAYRLKQVHGNHIEPVPVSEQTLGDGLLAAGVGESVWVGSADCTPILLADPTTGAVAAVHAGWRGTAQGVMTTAVAALKARGALPASILCALGPAISGSAYQVAEEVALEVTGTVREAQRAILDDPVPGRVRLDVREVNRQQALLSGLDPAHISSCPACTFGEARWLFSYRREGSGKIQFSGIGVPTP